MSADPQVEAIIAFLHAEGAADRRHSSSATLLDHLSETAAILGRWQQPPWLQHAALLHSVYGTESYREPLLSESRRRQVAELAGERAEHLAHRFATTPRSTLGDIPPGEERDALVLLHMANLAEQARAPDGSPVRWLVTLRELAELVIGSDVLRLPLFVAELALFTKRDESLTGRAYLAGLSARESLDARVSRLALAAATCPVIPEPCVWLARLLGGGGDLESGRAWAGRAIQRQLTLGTVWDKRLRFEEWLELAEALERQPASAPVDDPTLHPRALLEAVRTSPPQDAPVAPPYRRSQTAPDAASARFHRYVESLTRPGAAALGAIYPDLPSRPWYDASEFPVVHYLESHWGTIRDEILGLDPARFHRESERIPRAGDWDVAFFYERGRRNDETCLACPVTTHAIEAYPAVRTLAGLIYASRMAPSTHIRPHRGPTNLRLRCHLGLQVPDGDCAIRVGSETRRWEEGRCLVFDDFFEHEAWNHTGEERIVLIVDLWHPALTPGEVELLTGLQEYAYAHAQRLDRYWATNADAARAASVEA